jgi:hypothetical protein
MFSATYHFFKVSECEKAQIKTLRKEQRNTFINCSNDFAYLREIFLLNKNILIGELTTQSFE